jgi:hypothetical protein
MSGAAIEHLVAHEARPVAEGLRDVTLTDPAGAEQQHVPLEPDEATRRKVNDLGLWDLGVEEEIEVLQRLSMFEGCLAKPLFKHLAFSPLDFVCEQAQQKFGVCEIVIDGLGGA